MTQHANHPLADNDVPCARHQTAVPYEQILHSANAGLVVHRKAIAKAEFRSEARIFARELGEYITSRQIGVASVFVYEETFGTKDVVHWLMHISSLDAYQTMVRMGNSDPGFREIFFKERIDAKKGGGTWDRVFVDGSVTETVLLPQFYGMYGTAIEGRPAVVTKETSSGGLILPPAQHQTSVPPEQLLNSANAGIVIHRTGQLAFRFRSEGRQFARAVAETINTHQRGVASVFLYEEAFGRSDRIHWLIHLKDLSAYYSLIDMRAAMTPEVAAVYSKQWIPDEKGGGDWSRMFLDATLEDVALTPQHWNMYATQGSAQAPVEASATASDD
ncbi:hypothetical protein WI36_15925 [Burkholderia ubonensis]|uniref:DUF6039 family protein n=1 Tax=Burkholderia ubonensis TaxID=101571 RepID=UPI0007583D4D|nr:DUF6039 family protein [Burkholderia ubonensis]KUZ73241.1 hypothetical protein WI36_15925 [Burkholderia ubonensis]KVC55933.1 hypothetical protein WI72_03135 [Burkholderia ubonensis]KVD88649.1 hypothetical protein WI90_19625 [Burkholderia ubonensis]